MYMCMYVSFEMGVDVALHRCMRVQYIRVSAIYMLVSIKMLCIKLPDNSQKMFVKGILSTTHVSRKRDMQIVRKCKKSRLAISRFKVSTSDGTRSRFAALQSYQGPTLYGGLTDRLSFV